MSEYEKIGGGGFWKPVNTGDTIEGLYQGTEPAQGRFEGTNALLVTRSGEMYKVGISAGLKSFFQIVQPGRDVKIVYLGMKKNPRSGKEFKNFDTFAKKSNGNAAAAKAAVEASFGPSDVVSEEPF